MSEFVAGFAARHAAAADILSKAFAPPEGFAPRDIRSLVVSPGAPRHYSPADRAANPTAGWDPLDAAPQSTPFIDPLAAAHAAGYAEGLAAARSAGADADARDATLLTTLADRLADSARIDRAALAQQLRQTVLLLVEKIVGSTGVAADLLAARVEHAVELLADAAESALLRVHPDDVALLDGRLPKTVFAAGDANVARGSFVLESASTVIEDGPAMWLEQLAAAIDRVPVPTC